MLARRLPVVLSSVCLSLSVALSIASDAHAEGLEVCGDIDIEVDANCEIWVDVDCETRCQPLNVELSCSHNLWSLCEGMCQGEIDIECGKSCTEICVPDCDIDPGNFSCDAKCEADCDAGCEQYCQADETGTNCRASCRAECSARCEVGCEGQLPTATCDERCGDVCGARCEAESNFQCQVDCQRPQFDGCTAEVSGGCKTACESDGALFCDGQFIDHGGKLKACVDALNAYLREHVKTYGSASGECEGNRCEGEVEGGISCECRAAGPNAPSPWWSLMLAPLGLLRRRN